MRQRENVVRAGNAVADAAHKDAPEPEALQSGHRALRDNPRVDAPEDQLLRPAEVGSRHQFSISVHVRAEHPEFGRREHVLLVAGEFIKGLALGGIRHADHGHKLQKA